MKQITYKYRLFPTKKQQTILNKILEECCWLYNHFLEERKNSWGKEKKSLNYYAQAVTIPKLKKERPSLKSVPFQTLQNVAMRIDLAFKRFFRRVKKGEKKVGYSRFKGKGRYDSFTFPQVKFKIRENSLEIVKINSAFTSQDCSNCGHREAKELSNRIHHCSSCGFETSRDHNSALNILALGLHSLGNQSVKAPSFSSGE